MRRRTRQEDLLADLTTILYSFTRSPLWAAAGKTQDRKRHPHARSGRKRGRACNWLSSMSSNAQTRALPSIDAAAFKAKNLYNAALYLVRQAFIFEHRYLGYAELFHQMKGHEAYRALPAKLLNRSSAPAG